VLAATTFVPSGDNQPDTPFKCPGSWAADASGACYDGCAAALGASWVGANSGSLAPADLLPQPDLGMAIGSDDASHGAAVAAGM
jgi:hypothetical protein